YLPGFYFYLRACKENNYQISNRQKMVMAVVSLAAVLSIVAIATGMISV
ncbi:arginine-ornithine antiporter, partial [Escherichia coli]